MTAYFKCCEHCLEDPIHDIPPEGHEMWCSEQGCRQGKQEVNP